MRVLVLCVAALALTAGAAPFIPKSDSEVLEHLPLRANDRTAQELRQLRQQTARNPQDVRLAAELAQRYIEIGRADADPRYFGYAQAVLAPWWDKPKPPLSVLLLRATLRQSTHRFDPALADLNNILEAVPEHPQALLTRATIQQVRGNYADAKRDCAALGELVDPLVAATCSAGVAGASGGLQLSYAALKQALAEAAQAPPGIVSWVSTQLAEMAVRAGNVGAAQQHFRDALRGGAAQGAGNADAAAQGGQDAYLLAAYADFLLDEKRPQEVQQMLQNATRADALLLRFALAQQQLRSPQLAASVNALTARFEAARRRGERVHLREEARFQLQLLRQPRQALELARDNWSVQKEPADARVLLEAALAAKDKSAAQEVLGWLAANKLEDVSLERLREEIARL